MPRLPRVSGKETIRALQRAGFVVFDQEGAMSTYTADLATASRIA